MAEADHKILSAE
ncbi:hypothetical protein A2U01_0105218, partial [Trifolium medium]|nr:hypothetical protein [Trifolium medium]